MENVTFIDCETTGTDPNRHNVWEIAIIKGEQGYSWILELSGEELGAGEPMALAVTNYYERIRAAYHAASKPDRANRFWPIEEMEYVRLQDRPLLADFLAVTIGTSYLVGAVPSFDARFVGDFMLAHNRPPSWHYHLVDIEALAAGVLRQRPPWKSKDLYRAIGVDPEQFAEHTALGDTRMAKAVYERVMSGHAARYVHRNSLPAPGLQGEPVTVARS